MQAFGLPEHFKDVYSLEIILGSVFNVEVISELQLWCIMEMKKSVKYLLLLSFFVFMWKVYIQGENGSMSVASKIKLGSEELPAHNVAEVKRNKLLPVDIAKDYESAEEVASKSIRLSDVVIEDENGIEEVKLEKELVDYPILKAKQFTRANYSSLGELKVLANQGGVDAKYRYGGELQQRLIDSAVDFSAKNEVEKKAWMMQFESAVKYLVDATSAGHRVPPTILANLYIMVDRTPAYNKTEAVAWYYIDQWRGNDSYGAVSFIDLLDDNGEKLFNEKTVLEGRELAKFYVDFYGIP